MATTKTDRPGTLVRLSSLALLTSLLVFRTPLIELSLNGISAIATVISIFTLLAVARVATHRVYSAGFLYLLTLSLFHLGLSYLTTFGLPFGAQYQDYLDTWFRQDSYAVEAVYLSVLAIVAFTLVYSWSTMRQADRPARSSPRTVQPDPVWLARIGTGLIVSGTLMFLGYIAILNPALLKGGNYSNFDLLVGGSGPISAGFEIIAIGAAMAAAAPRGRARRIGMITFGIFSVIVLGMGSRTAVMYGAIGAIAATARMHRMPRVRVGVIGLLLAVIAVGVVGQSRDLASGASTPANGVSFTPVPALAEMGGSLRPLVETLDWRRGFNEPQMNGITYLAGPLRIYERVMGIKRPEPDQRFASTLTSERVAGYNIGYSAVAEAFLNFGTAGVIGFFALLGWLLGKVDNSWGGDAFVTAGVGILVFTLSYEVRQASNIVVTLLAAGLLAVASTRLIAMPKKTEELQARIRTPTSNLLASPLEKTTVADQSTRVSVIVNGRLI